MRFVFFLFGLCLVSLSATALAKPPTVFVYGGESNDAWWLRKAIIRPMDTSVSGVSISVVNGFADRGPAATKICFIEQLSRHSFAGISRDVQTAIDSTFAEFPDDRFAVDFSSLSGAKFRARMAAIEYCDSGDVGFALLVLDATGQLKFVEEWLFDDSGRSNIQFILKNSDGEVVTSQCFLCGDASVLHFDEHRSRFYWEYIGD